MERVRTVRVKLGDAYCPMPLLAIFDRTIAVPSLFGGGGMAVDRADIHPGDRAIIWPDEAEAAQHSVSAEH